MRAARTWKARAIRRAVRAATVTTLHQAIAFDALNRLAVSDADRWERLFHRHARILALGAAAPDADFRDFRNHLLFPNDGMWGGAAGKADCWHRNLVSALANAEWQNAAYCAGVLSHYVIDALHPFHTAQSQADNDVYAALAYCSYVNYQAWTAESAKESAKTDKHRHAAASAAVVAGAIRANRRYDELLHCADPRRLTLTPKRALDQSGEALMARIMCEATDLIAALVALAIEQSRCTAPPTSVAHTALHAVAALPLAVIARRRQKHALRCAAEHALAEFSETGRVTEAAPPEVRVKRELYAREVSAKSSDQGRNIVPLAIKSSRVGQLAPEPATAEVLAFKPAHRSPAGVALLRRRDDVAIRASKAARVDE